MTCEFCASTALFRYHDTRKGRQAFRCSLHRHVQPEFDAAARRDVVLRHHRLALQRQEFDKIDLRFRQAKRASKFKPKTRYY